ncbi:MAG: hypothetical protein K2J13_04955, partial [Clostridia bacterium]|nr:hypothetical protein [Clostridia bacterium]
VGKYIVVLSIDETDEDNYRNYKIKETCIQFDIEITPYQITAIWDTDGDTPILSGLTEDEKEIIEYVYYDNDGNEIGVDVDVAGLEVGKYTVMARIKSDYEDNYEFIDKKGNVLKEPTITDEQSFEIKEEPTPEDPNIPVDPENPEDPKDPATGFDFSKVGEVLKQWWQVIVSIISIILILIFVTKGIGYASKKKENSRQISKYNTFYATGLFGITMTNWTIIACILMGVAVLAFVFMILEKGGFKKSQRSLEDAKDEYAKNQKDAESKQMQMMLMGMLGGNANGQGGQGFVYQQPSLGADDIRGIVADTMTNMLPNVTQYLPQEASHNDELIQQLMEQNAQNEERIENLVKQLAEQNKSNVGEDTIERLVEKLSKQNVNERQAEREVASTNANDEKIEMLIRNQEMLMRQMMEMASRNNDKQIVMPYMQQPIMAQPIIQQPAEKIIIEKPVEKIVEKEVVKEVPVEKIVEVEKVVEKVVHMPDEK